MMASIVLLSLFVPVIVRAQSRGPLPTCTIAQSDITAGVVKVSKFKVNKDEAFDIYADAQITDTKANECKTSGQSDYSFSYYIYNGDITCTLTPFGYNYRVSSVATFYTDANTGKSGFREKITDATLNKFFAGTTVTSYGDSNCLYVYIHPKTVAPTSSTPYLTYKGGPNDTNGYILFDPVDHPTVTDTTLPKSPDADSYTTPWASLSVNNNTEAAKADQLAVDLKPGPDGAGLRSKYRLSLEDTTPIEFGTTKGLDAVYGDWGASSPKLGFNQYIGIPDPSKAVLEYDYSPQFKYVKIYFADGSKAWDPKTQCVKDTNSNEDCSKIVYVDDSFGKGSSETFSTKGLLAGTFNPTLKPAAWAKSEFQGKTVTAGQPLGTVQLYAIPILWGNNGRLISYVIGKGNLTKVAIEVFKTDADITAACKADQTVTDKTKCDDINFAKFGFASAVTQSSSSSETAAASVSQTLYAFIVRVISVIITWLQSIIYSVFALIIVPVLNALLKIRPYQDTFVDIIYPGWLILRNLANIFFIVSLLVVGLRILFQQSAASAARGFILRLVIMALLVNFSLVIGQGLIGIADTVQSQFLPADTRVIEALGSKLMVEPLKTFRSEVVGDTGVFDAGKSELALADTVKPIVLLLLSIAAFFSFIAIAAFLAVRLVALWVLYMLSPIAYVGFVMEETKKYASQWWSEFIKYAIMTPVLVFFLNIAALMATVFSGSNNSLFKFSDSLTGDIVAGGLTVTTHFIVLGFIFAGMKFASSSGTFGAKAIVDGAKKGFDTLTTRPAKWAADVGKSAAQTQWDRRFKGGMLDPLAYRDAFKKKVADTTKNKYSERILSNANKLSPAGLFEKPKQALRYLYHKGSTGSTHALADRAEKLIDQSETLTADERKSLDTKFAGEQARLSPLAAALQKLNANSPLSVAEGQDLTQHLSDEETRLGVERVKVANDLRTEAATLAASGNMEASKAKYNQAKGVEAEYQKKQDDLKELREKLEPVVASAVAAGNKDITLDDNIKEDITDRVTKDIEDLGKDLKKLKSRQDEDNRRLAAYGGAAMTLETRRALQNEANEFNKKSLLRAAPESSIVRQIRREREDEEKKKIEDTDDPEELIAQYKKAIGSNNLPLASAIAKKMATEGGFKDLLKEYGYSNNAQALQEFISDHFKKYAPQVRLQIMSEIGTLNEKNGNRGASRATKIDTDSGKMRLSTPSEQKSKHDAYLSKRPLSEAKKMKRDDFGQEGADGRLQLFKGSATLLSQFKTLKRPGPTAKKDEIEKYDRRILEWQRDMAPTARAILEATNSNLIDPESIEVLIDIAGAKRTPTATP